MMNPLIIHSLCWTFIHSLWQGLIVAIIAGIVIQSTIHQKASVRYNALLLLFLAFIAIVGYTFFSYWQDDIALNAAASRTTIIVSNSDFSTVANHQALQCTDFIDQHIHVLFALWALFFTINIFSLGKEAIMIRQLKNSGSTLISQEWINRFDELCKKMKIHQAVQFRSTSIIQSPMLIGYYKPIILLPLAMFTDLTPLQIEAIILHELAHIKRHDFVINVVQRLMVCILFFNPFIRWVSARIDAEREYCCDAYALTSEQSKVDFVQTLLYFNMERKDYGNLALRFFPTRMHLLQRVQRIFNNKNNELMNIEKTFLAASILFTTFSSIIYFGHTSTFSTSLTTRQHTLIALDTLKPLGQRISKTSALSLSNNSIIRKGDTISVPGEGIFYFENMDVAHMSDEDILEKIQLHNIAIKEHEQAIIEHEKYTEQHHKAMIEHDAAMVEHDAAMAEHDAAMAEHTVAQATHEAALHQQNMASYTTAKTSHEDSINQASLHMSSTSAYGTEAEMKKMEAEMKQMEKESKKHQKELLKMEKEQQKQVKEMVKMEKEQQKHQKEMVKMEQEIEKEMKKQDQADVVIKAIIESLIKDKIIVSSKNVSFLLSEKEFIVNGVKQSKDVWQKYHKQYSKGKISYAHNYHFEIKD